MMPSEELWSEEKKAAWEKVAESMRELRRLEDLISLLERGEAPSVGQGPGIIRQRIRASRRDMMMGSVDLVGYLHRFHALEE